MRTLAAVLLAGLLAFVGLAASASVATVDVAASTTSCPGPAGPRACLVEQTGAVTFDCDATCGVRATGVLAVGDIPSVRSVSTRLSFAWGHIEHGCTGVATAMSSCSFDIQWEEHLASGSCAAFTVSSTYRANILWPTSVARSFLACRDAAGVVTIAPV